MAWLRVDNQLVDLEGAVAYELFEGMREEEGSRWNVYPGIFINYRDQSHRKVNFRTKEEASQVFEAIFKMLMPDAAQQLETPNGSGTNIELGGEGVSTDPHPEA